MSDISDPCKSKTATVSQRRISKQSVTCIELTDDDDVLEVISILDDNIDSPKASTKEESCEQHELIGLEFSVPQISTTNNSNISVIPLKVSIVDLNDTKGRISEGKEEIINEIVKKKFITNCEDTKKFTNFIWRYGHLQIDCIDNAARKFLVQYIQKLKPPWRNCLLAVVHRNYFNPFSKRIQLYVNMLLPNHKEFMKIVQNHNPNLSVSQWVADYDDDDQCSNGCLRTFYVDIMSFEELIKSGGYIKYYEKRIMFNLYPNHVFNINDNLYDAKNCICIDHK